MFIDDGLHNVDDNNRAVYLQLMTQRWLGLRLEILGAFICFFTATLAVVFAQSFTAVS